MITIPTKNTSPRSSLRIGRVRFSSWLVKSEPEIFCEIIKQTGLFPLEIKHMHVAGQFEWTAICDQFKEIKIDPLGMDYPLYDIVVREGIDKQYKVEIMKDDND